MRAYPYHTLLAALTALVTLEMWLAHARHCGVGRNPEQVRCLSYSPYWIPAFAGMTGNVNTSQPPDPVSDW